MVDRYEKRKQEKAEKRPRSALRSDKTRLLSKQTRKFALFFSIYRSHFMFAVTFTDTRQTFLD